MAKHEYGGDINLAFWVESDEPLTREEILLKIAEQINDEVIASGMLSEIDHWIDGEPKEIIHG